MLVTKKGNLLISTMIRTIFHQGSLRAVPNREPVLRVLTAKEPALSQENWFQSGTNSLLVLNQEPLTSRAGGEIIVTNKTK